MTGRKIICIDLSDILYSGGTLDENSWIVWTHLLWLYAPAVTLHSMRIMFTLRILIGMSDLCHFRGRNIRVDENPNSDPMLSGLIKFIL